MPSERCFLAKNFNPPTPHGVGQQVRISMHIYFQISIHPPRMGWDIAILHPLCGNKNFNPPTPHGVGPNSKTFGSTVFIFQSTHPAWGGTMPRPHYGGSRNISIHPPRMGWDLIRRQDFIPDIKIFQSTHPAWGGTGRCYLVDPFVFDFNPPTPHGVGLTTSGGQKWYEKIRILLVP